MSANPSPIEKVFARVNYEQRSPSSPSEQFRLDTIRTILDRLGNPQNDLAIIHIAGTKGKGSTAQFVSSIANSLGLKSAVYSSPHFVRYSERFVIDGQEVATGVLEQAIEEVLTEVELLDQSIRDGSSSLKPATFFDISTATAFLLFQQAKVDLVALETGLGGRLDSTNVCQPVVSVITNISLDHTRQLGNTTPEIAAEKAAIIKQGIPAVVGRVDEDVWQVISHRAQTVNAPLYRFGRDFGPQPDRNLESPDGIVFNYRDQSGSHHDEYPQQIDDVALATAGYHQVDNACLAIAAMRLASGIPRLQTLQRTSFATAVRQGLSQVRLKGRLQVVQTEPTVVMDMAHNQASIRAMVRCLQSRPRSGPRQAVFSCARDKDHRAMLPVLAGFFDRIIFTEFQKNPRALRCSVLLQHARQDVENLSTEILAIADPIDAYRLALENAGTDGMIVVCGSIFLVGELMEVFFPDKLIRGATEPQTPCPENRILDSGIA